MFERRLRFILAVPILAGLVLVARLYDLQVVRGANYRMLAEEALVAPRQYLPPLRGRILDRHGRTLLSDEPALDAAVHYGALSMDASYLQRAANQLRRSDTGGVFVSAQQAEAEVLDRIRRMWLTLERVGGLHLHELGKRRESICKSVETLRRHIWAERKRQGFEEPFEKMRLQDENWYYTVLYDISPEQRTQLEIELAGLPFFRVEPSVRRVWSDDAESVCHLLGMTGEVSAERIEADPLRSDPLARYRPGDKAGAGGVELLGEQTLRGRRGYEDRDLDGNRCGMQPPEDGGSVRLTIDIELQERVADILAAAVAEQFHRTGASCVVIDVRSREVLALVSVPTFTHRQFQRDYAMLRDDAARRPLLFRAVAEEYQPGSILKPVVLLAGFTHNVVDPATAVFCNGAYVSESDHWHCWTHWKGLPGHGQMAAEEALMHSCNVYFYSLGERLHARRLADFFESFIRGPSDRSEGDRGTGLLEERAGIIPTLDWITSEAKRRFRKADGRNYAIGQGEIQLTPLQAANVFATLATGRYRPPTILADGWGVPDFEIPGVPDEAWEIVRRGLYRCVNEVGGTAYQHARMDNLEICGKTGSAQCVARIIESKYTLKHEDGRTEYAIAPSLDSAREMLNLPDSIPCVGRKILKRWPPNRPEKDSPETHAWFAAFAPYRNPRVALAVILEHGGSGGQSAGPVGRSILEALRDSPHGYLGRGETIAARVAPANSRCASTMTNAQ